MEMNLKGLTPKIQEDNSIVFLNSEEEPEFIMPAPFMTDEAEGYSEDIELQIERIEEITATGETSEKYLLKLTPDKEWLNAEERVYPVTIDPTVSPANAKTNVRDTYIYTGDSTKHNSETTMYVGLRKGNVNRSFIKFTTMPTIKGYINTASLVLTATSGTSTYGSMRVCKVNQNWDSSTITWENQPTLINYKGSYDRTDYNLTFDVTSTVKSWYSGSTDGTTNNYGVSIRYVDEEYEDYNRFYTSEAASNKPVLSIKYTLNDSEGDTVSTANTGVFNKYSNGEVDYGTDVDFYKFTPSVSGGYRFESKGSIDVKAYLYKGNSTSYVAVNDDDGDGFNFKLDYDLVAGQTYYLKVQCYSKSATGKYQIVASMYDNGIYSKDIEVTPVGEDAQKSIDEGEATYNSVIYDLDEAILIGAEYATANNFATGLSVFPDINVASEYLLHFLHNVGTDKTDYPVKRMVLNDEKEGYTETKQYKFMVDEVNEILESSEYFAIEGQNVQFVSIYESSSGFEDKMESINWFLSLNRYRMWTRSSVTLESSGVYTATIEYNIRDYYDWDDEKMKSLNFEELFKIPASMCYNMHLAGVGKCFNTSGTAIITVIWNKGERIGSGAACTIAES